MAPCPARWNEHQSPVSSCLILRFANRATGIRLVALVISVAMYLPFSANAQSASDLIDQRQAGEAHVKAAWEAIATGRFDIASSEVALAQADGIDVATVTRELSNARAMAIQRHIVAARSLVKGNDPDSALVEVEKAEALDGGTGSQVAMRQAISKTPKAKAREAARSAKKTDELNVFCKGQDIDQIRQYMSEKQGVANGTMTGKACDGLPCNFDVWTYTYKAGPRKGTKVMVGFGYFPLTANLHVSLRQMVVIPVKQKKGDTGWAVELEPCESKQSG